MIVTINDIQDGAAIQDSTMLRVSPDSGYGDSVSGLIGHIVYEPAKYIIKVDLSAYAEVTPTLAKFSVKVNSMLGTLGTLADVYWHRVLRAWAEDQVTWNNYTTSSPWTVAGCNGEGTGSDREASSQNISPLTIDSVVWYDFDCLPFSVESDVGGNFSIIISDIVTSYAISADSTETSSGNYPYFYMEYTDNTPSKNIRYMKQGDRNLLKRRF